MRGPDDLDEDQRARIRYQVLASLRGRHATIGDRLYDLFALAALPTPHLIRALGVATLALGLAATATTASAQALPDDALYGVKLAGEQMRLGLALTPEDRAAVQLSMAEHRLAEAEQLALDGRTSDALVATSAYGQHLASAAAALATIERLDPSVGPVVERLRQRLAAQQTHAADVAALLGADPGSLTAPVFRTIASVAPLATGALPLTAQIAEHAASVTERIASEAARLARAEQVGVRSGADSTRPPTTPAGAPSPTRTPARTGAPRPAGAGQPARTPVQATTAPRPTPHETAKPATAPQSAALNAAERAKQEAEKAREAADKAREAAKKTASPTPTPRH